MEHIKNMEKLLRIAILFAHPDDEHIPFGLPAELTLKGHDVSLISLTKGNLGSHEMTSRRKIARIRKKEFQESARILHVSRATILGLPDGTLHHYVRKAEKRLLKKLRIIRPDVVIIPASMDYHQDHRTTHEIGKWAIANLASSAYVTRQGILRRKIAPFAEPVSVYEADTQGSQTWISITEDNGENRDNLHTVNTILPISIEAIETSIDAFHEHTSQLRPRPDGQTDYVTLAKLGSIRRGKQAGFDYGVGLNFLPFGGYAFSANNRLAKLFISL